MASATASSNYTASASAGIPSSNYATTTNFNDFKTPKFSEYRSRVMLGELPQDFLRVQFAQAQMYDPAVYGARQNYQQMTAQQIQQNPNFLGYFTLTIVEARLVKGSSLMGLMKMDPYVTFRIGHVSLETQTASSGGKNPQWKASYRINLYKGMDRINLEVYDQRNFTEDSFIGECEILIPREVMEGETRQHWYPLMGRQANANDNQGDILIVMSFISARSANQPAAANPTNRPVANPPTQPSTNAAAAASASQPVNNRIEQEQPIPAQRSPSAVPKPPPPPYSQEDIRAIQEMFPTIDQRTIIGLLDQHNGNMDLVVNQLLQNTA